MFPSPAAPQKGGGGACLILGHRPPLLCWVWFSAVGSREADWVMCQELSDEQPGTGCHLWTVLTKSGLMLLVVSVFPWGDVLLCS